MEIGVTGTRSKGEIPRSAGLRVLVPGFAQWAWGQGERGLVLFGTFAAAMSVSVFAWGTTTGVVMLALAFATHVVSSVDAVQQNVFPGPCAWATFLGVGTGLAVGVYAPGLALAFLVAWPGVGIVSEKSEEYLVNCWAYHGAEPRQDDWIWYRPTPSASPRIGRVVAGRGQEVEWTSNQLRLDGHLRSSVGPLRSARPPRELSYRIPDGHVLVKPEGLRSRPFPGGVVMVATEQIVGRAWAQMYPVRERRLLQ